ncbi:MAG: hypothetical protein JGK17_04360 [Microcoleus sp. PH2017_10_PVI_O_A]|uniref:hypothetical protein n=1 Tax=unclassified Microcoleus TaxID=2642155 RepID=UPI001DC57045|nr:MULTISPECIES: hypothetical protein [unclassified Microcoleus]MCC3404820.1 hypothetical protein [Microcoleus sp. PH2017_10_PVI_O_A]MCC3458926.1 hypothetical protein [Microcoleus sp. PH2017_11_PCY_U_A]MCC3477127.1 hypothetical protein [Microcoleus sp. PH2017_12_PCY_D_A]MCC3558322.1 hypothetical protein [Microcoleus sp. PH2017_27_LUM_O_A]
METINLKEEVRSIIDKLPENFTWSDLICAIYLRQRMQSQTIHIQGIKPEVEPETLDEVAESSPKRSIFGSDRELITTSDDFDEPLELLPSPLVARLLEKTKELTKVSAELSEIIAKIEKERQIDEPHNFWEAIQNFRQKNNLEAAGIEAEVFEGLRDSAPGREVVL